MPVELALDSTHLYEIDQISKDAHRLIEVGSANELLIFDEVLDLVEVAVLESFHLAAPEVFHVHFEVLVVFDGKSLELAKLAPVQGMSQLEEAKRLKLHSF